MKKILLDGNEVQSQVTESLPMLIHGKEGSGASLYTICLAVKWFTQGSKVLFLCGYPMAQQEFEQQIGATDHDVKFFTKEKVNKFIKELTDINNHTIIFVKNIELFDTRLIEKIKNISNLIISGDIDKSDNKSELLSIKFQTEVYFSSLDDIEIPELEKYHGHFISNGTRGIASLL